MPDPRFLLEFDEAFVGYALSEDRWLPYYLPHWSTWPESAARYAVADQRLHLMIEEEQPPWSPALDGELRVSSLQTALVAGAVGTTSGQHQFDPPAIVRNGPHDIRLYTPQFGRFKIRSQASADPRLMFALWMIGLGDTPERTAEICVCEIFGRDVGPDGAAIGVGVHPHQDPAVVDEFERVVMPIDVREFHDYAAEWTPNEIAFFIDGQRLKTVRQTIAYPMQFMLGLYEFPADSNQEAAVPSETYPKRVTVESVRGYRLVE